MQHNDLILYTWQMIITVSLLNIHHLVCVCLVVSDSFVTPWTSLPASSVCGISQARVLEWVAVSFSRGSSLIQRSNPYLPHLLHWQVGSSPLSHLGSPLPSSSFQVIYNMV